MRHDEVTLFESKAIASYIDRAFPGAKNIHRSGKSGAMGVLWQCEVGIDTAHAMRPPVYYLDEIAVPK
jgi:glutathione S-transferase